MHSSQYDVYETRRAKFSAAENVDSRTVTIRHGGVDYHVPPEHWFVIDENGKACVMHDEKFQQQFAPHVDTLAARLVELERIVLAPAAGETGPETPLEGVEQNAPSADSPPDQA